MASQKLWDHMRWMVSHGRMYLRREEHLIFHGCVPVDQQGEFLPMPVDGQPYSGRALFDAIESFVYRLLDGPVHEELDLLWYLWSGPHSPLFGKIDYYPGARLDQQPANTHRDQNPYFRLIHEPWFCDQILSEFGVHPTQGLIVNGHVPVEVEKANHL
jgi:fructose-1,6-bisphosphatase-3